MRIVALRASAPTLLSGLAFPVLETLYYLLGAAPRQYRGDEACPILKAPSMRSTRIRQDSCAPTAGDEAVVVG